jgi:hypothetical protein
MGQGEYGSEGLHAHHMAFESSLLTVGLAKRSLNVSKVASGAFGPRNIKTSSSSLNPCCLLRMAHAFPTNAVRLWA